jgi:hypothetical protein
VRERYGLPDVTVVRLKRVGLDSEVARAAKAWVLSMDDDRDNEDGPDFWEWIERHYRNPSTDTLLDTFFLVDKQARRMIKKEGEWAPLS